MLKGKRITVYLCNFSMLGMSFPCADIDTWTHWLEVVEQTKQTSLHHFLQRCVSLALGLSVTFLQDVHGSLAGPSLYVDGEP